MNIEICLDNLESIPHAIAGGADRIELCSSLALGGLTPSYGVIKQALAISSVPIFVMIRPRQGDFIYKEDDVICMAEDIKMAKELGAQGVVFGALTAQGQIDNNAMQVLTDASQGMGITFHRAFDYCQNPTQSLEQIIALGCERILTSGLTNSAINGADTIAQLVEQAKGRIEIMAGAGINEHNVRALVEQTKVTAIHLSAKGSRPSDMECMTQSLSMGANAQDDLFVPLTQSKLISKIRKIYSTSPIK